MVGESSVYY